MTNLSKQMYENQEEILNHIIDLKQSSSAMSTDIKSIRRHLEKLNGTVASHEEKINNIRLQIAKWGGAIAVIVFIITLCSRYI